MQRIGINLLDKERFSFHFFYHFFRTLRYRQVITRIGTLVFLRFFGRMISRATIRIFAARINVAINDRGFRNFFTIGFISFSGEGVRDAAARIVGHSDAITDAFIRAMDRHDYNQFISSAFCFRADSATYIFNYLALDVIGMYQCNSGDFDCQFARMVFDNFLRFFRRFDESLQQYRFLTFGFSPYITIVDDGGFRQRSKGVALCFFILRTTTGRTFGHGRNILQIHRYLAFDQLAGRDFAVLNVNGSEEHNTVTFNILRRTEDNTVRGHCAEINDARISAGCFARLGISAVCSIVV